jgi:hypothetical protein
VVVVPTVPVLVKVEAGVSAKADKEVLLDGALVTAIE